MATANRSAASRATPQTKAVYIVVSPLEHNRELYEPGDEVELTQAEADKLLGHTVKAKPE